MGVDIGAGLVKVSAGNSTAEIPSKLLFLNKSLPECLGSSQIWYEAGNAKHLIGKEFLVGEPAQWKAPTNHIKLSDNPALKSEYALEALLGAISKLPYRQKWNLSLAISNHNRKMFADTLRKNLEGEHIVKFGDSDLSAIYISVAGIYPEGAGSYLSAISLQPGLTGNLIVGVDFGTSTIICQTFSPHGKMLFHQPLELGGVIELLNAIATDDKLVRCLGTGKPGNTELIRRGIISRNFKYGNTDFNFGDIYQAHFKYWISDRIRLIREACREWENEAIFLAWGGGSMLPGMEKYLGNIKILPNGGWANALGLELMAKSKVAK
ncbi:MAG TPA: hypothetical protein DDW51_05555 [Cyanobacteria bacterium UBA11367]|nr:hypothetical protein [Cyanobacteria bacterium UBA11367]HBE56799.1 hypothetical protein [Cyanobacteria bacterium UBA11366]HCA94640.1 hypothetical protein [Cyanobacteria bacterium UBA9226]